MAKKEKQILLALSCSECKRHNYTTTKTSNVKEKLAVKKFCEKCGKHTDHKEAKIS